MTLSQRDDHALEKIQDEVRLELPRARAAATSWVAGLTAVAGVLGTATVVSTGTEVQDLAGSWRLPVVGAAIVLGAFAVVFGILRIYAAANVSPIGAARATLAPYIKNEKDEGAANAWELAVQKAVETSQSYRKQAVGWTLAGVLALALALAITWLGPTGSATSTPACIEVGGSVLTFDGELPELTDGEYQVVPCS